MPKLRGHHLICLHFFHGEGYSPGFVDNLRTVMKLVDGRDIELCRGPDDICGSCPYLHDEKCRYAESAEEEVRRMDEKALSLLCLSPEKSIGWQEIRERLPAIFPEWYRLYCAGCTWKGACEKDEAYRQLVGRRKAD